MPSNLKSLSSFQPLKQLASGWLMNAKQSPSSRTPVEMWYPYYAGFSERFATKVIQALSLPAGATILDPWNGSGTTTHVADMMGYCAIGLDLNPVAALVASAKLAHPLDATYVLGLAQKIATFANVATIPQTNRRGTDPLSDWLKPINIKQYRSIENGILENLGTDRHGRPLKALSKSLPPLASFLLLALMRAARRLAAIRSSSNPTWISPQTSKNKNRSSLPSLWLNYVEQMAADLASETKSSRSSEIHIGDARQLPFKSNTVDAVLTSPPYCTRIDYAINCSFELAAFGLSHGSNEIKSLRRNLMGTPLVRDAGIQAMPTEPETHQSVLELLERIRNHPSKASHSYYYKTYRQYFKDCELALLELRRCLRSGGSAVIVVQSSHYKDILVDLPQLYIDIASELGFTGEILTQAPVSRALVQINTRSMKYRQHFCCHESVIALEKNLSHHYSNSHLAIPKKA
jgi:DNA methylase